MSQIQHFLNNRLARATKTHNQQGTLEMSDEVLSSVGAEDIDTRRYHVSKLDDADFYREKGPLDVDAVFRPEIGTHFSPTAVEDLERGGSAENPNLLDEEEDEENSPPTTPVSE